MKRMTIAAIAAASTIAPAFADTSVEIPFIAEVAGQPLACGQSYPDLGSAATTAQMLDYRLYVSDPVLIAGDGSRVPLALEQDGVWQVGQTALLDFEDGSASCVNGTPQMNQSLRGTVPEGDYTGLEFRIGVPFAQNHLDPVLAPSPLNLTGMFWNWQGGYKFIKIEFAPDGMAADSKGWTLHLGSTGCASSDKTVAPAQACANPNVVSVSLPGFDPASNSVVIDPAPVVAGADLTTNAPDTSAGCMSSPEDSDCDTAMPRLGLPFNDLPAGDQQLVTLR
ncbi:MbnP family copper-binding protein [Paracoccus sp. (in: a-proteobacteria)]|uniref:MbnP family copper-binding protein n=1 Tax=Paracoccus sp. TaxID=267 RepID=UPI003A865F85